MTDMTYDAEADAVYIALGSGKIVRTRKNGAFSYGVDAQGRIVGIEIRSATKMLAPGDWEKARPPKRSPRERRAETTLHKGFLFIRRTSQFDDELP